MVTGFKVPIKAGIVLAIITILLGSIYWLYFNHAPENIEPPQQKTVETSNYNESNAEIEALFELYLDQFKEELKVKAKEYKKSRSLLKEIFSPYNFETPEYTKENYTIFKEQITPNLRGKSGEIINIFERYQKIITENLGNKDSEISKLFLSQWQEMSRKQLGNYINFFTKEEQLIQAYEELMEFYYVHSNLFKVDIENNEIIFERAQDKETETILREQIKVLRK